MDELKDILVDVYLYGELASYGGKAASYGFANLQVKLKEGSVIRELLDYLGIPAEKRGITFINGALSAMPGLQPDLDHALKDNDRVAFFDLKSMWPFQYRHDVASLSEFKEALAEREDSGLQSRYD